MHKVFCAPRSELILYRDVIVDGGTGVIIDSDGDVVLEQADELMFWKPETLSRSYRSGSTAEVEENRRRSHLFELATDIYDRIDSSVTLDEGVNYVYMLHPFGFYAFGHFFDSVQRLFHSIFSVPAPWCVLHSDSQRIIDFARHMTTLGIPQDSLLQVDRRTIVKVPKLWVSPWQAPPAQFVPDIYEWLYERYTAGIKDNGRYRLYLSRNHVRPGHRSVLNEDDILDELRNYRFLVLRGEESFDEILRYFHNAEMIIAPHGSLLANTMFCFSGCKIFEFCPSNRVDQSFKLKHKRAKYYRHFLCEADQNYNIEIPIDEIRTILAGLN